MYILLVLQLSMHVLSTHMSGYDVASGQELICLLSVFRCALVLLIRFALPSLPVCLFKRSEINANNERSCVRHESFMIAELTRLFCINLGS